MYVRFDANLNLKLEYKSLIEVDLWIYRPIVNQQIKIMMPIPCGFAMAFMTKWYKCPFLPITNTIFIIIYVMNC